MYQMRELVTAVVFSVDVTCYISGGGGSLKNKCLTATVLIIPTITRSLQLSYPLHLVCTNSAFLRCLNWCYCIEPNVLVVYFCNHILQYKEINNKGQYFMSSKMIMWNLLMCVMSYLFLYF